MYTWIIEGKLAQAPLLSRSELSTLVKEFEGIIVLPMTHELPPLYLEYLSSIGFETLHIPTPDFHPVDLLDVLRACHFIKEYVSRGGSIIVQCYGGLGRSGQITASYLVFEGYNVYDAIKYVRSRVPGSIENQWQIQLVEDLFILLNNVNRSLLYKYLRVINEMYEINKVSYKHLSKTLQFTIELYNGLGLRTVEIKEELLRAMLHIHDFNLLKYIKNVVNTDVVTEKKEGLVQVAHYFDYKMDSRAVVLHTRSTRKPEILVLCREPCSDIAIITKNEIKLLSELLEEEPVIDWGMYLDYV